MPDRYEAPPEEMATRRALADRVDAELPATEQETSLSVLGQNDYFRITSYNEALVRGLLEHRYAQIEWLYAVRGGEPNQRVSIEEAAALPPEASVEGVCCELPVGCLTVKGKPRSRDRLSGIINTPAEAEQAREDFAAATGD